ncbi:MAG: TetR/AcrR family transcriptional regulator [Bacteroidales bacterium]|nr:TetR/AcrR family transcriptional regulator [Bacteroidales bacterium]
MENSNKNTLKERIIEVASEMFSTYSCKQITMDTIAKEMGISKRTIYENFSDKEMLLEKCISHILEKENYFERLKSENNPNFLITLSKFTDLHSSESFKLHCASTQDIIKYYPEIYNTCIIPKNKQIIEIVTDLLQKSQNDGYIDSKIDINIATSMLGEIIKAIIYGKVFFENEYSKTEIIEQTLFVYLRGMATKKALEEYDEYKISSTEQSI